MFSLGGIQFGKIRNILQLLAKFVIGERRITKYSPFNLIFVGKEPVKVMKKGVALLSVYLGRIFRFD